MIRGTVSVHRVAVVRLRVRGPGGAEVDVDAVIDSGFTGALTLPAATVAGLGLPRHSTATAVLADGLAQKFDNCVGEVEWDGAWRSVMVSAIGDQVLLGMRMLLGHQLRIDVVPGGAVEITPIP